MTTLLGVLQTYGLLIGALAVAAFVGAGALSRRVEMITTRVALGAFGQAMPAIDPNRDAHTTSLRAARFPVTYRVYAATTFLYAATGALVGGVVGMYLVWWVLQLFALDQATLEAWFPEQLEFLAQFAGLGALSPLQVVPLFVISALTVGAAVGGVIYWLRWWYPRSLAEARANRIDASLPQIVAFIYALARSGMEFPQVMRIVGTHQNIYGAAAEEFEVGVRHMDIFGRDMATALQLMTQRSPSKTFKEFGNNLRSVIQSGRNLEAFLEEQYDAFQEEAEAQQRQLLTLLAAVAEAYVTLFVAGPLLLITILVILGLTGANTLTPLQVFVYLIMPAANIAFVAYLNSALGGIGIQSVRKLADDARDHPWIESVEAKTPRADGGARTAVLRDRLRWHRRLRRLRATVGTPKQTLRDRPEVLLYVTVPLGVVVVILQLISLEAVTVWAVENLLVQMVLFVAGTFAVAYEYHHRHIRRLEAAVPDFLDRLASVNQAGMTLIESVERVGDSDLGALNEEVDRLGRDIRWGADIERALYGLQRRVQTPSVSRIVVLITNAMSASGNIAKVLRIAADQATADRRLRRERRQEMLTYTIVIYVSFGVFLIIVAALDLILLPNLPEAGVVPDDSPGAVPGGGVLQGFGDVQIQPFREVFRHAAYIQAVVTGLIAGQMSRGDIRAGATHMTVLLLAAYLTFLLL